MKFLWLLIFSFIGFNCRAQECTPSSIKTENVAEYLNKIAESLTHIKIQFQKISSLLSKRGSDATDILVALKELKSGYQCSSEMIGSYKKSKVENISKSSDALSQSYQLLGSEVDESITDIKSTLDGKTKLSPGERADRDAEKMIKVKKKWELVIIAISLGTYAAVGTENPKTKKLDTLVITKIERDNIVKTLKSMFTLPQKKGDSDPVDAAAQIYFSFLNQSWRFK